MNGIAQLLADTASRLLDHHAAKGHEETNREALLAAVRDAGLHLTLVPEDNGGAGLGIVEAAQIARIWGRKAAILPIAEILLAARIAPLFGDDETSASVSATTGLTLTLDGGQARLAGSPIDAPLIPGCRQIYAAAKGVEGEYFIVSLSPDAGDMVMPLTGEPWVRLGPTAAKNIRVVPVAGTEHARLEGEGALLTAAAITGAMRGALDLVVEYANTRKQFGRPIGKFQAIQHHLADMACELALCEAALNRALSHPEDDLDRMTAKAQAGQAASRVATLSHQVMGAIGFTAEHALHHYTKRLWFWRDAWGRQDRCEQAIGTMALQSSDRGLWSFLVDRTA